MKTTINTHNRQRGAGHLVVIIACLVIVGLFAIGWTVSKRSQQAKDSKVAQQDKTQQPAQRQVQDESTNVSWQMTNEGGWIATGGTPPKCPNPILKQSPVDTTKPTALLIPGQYRGTHFKAHGGFRYEGTTNAVKVELPIDAKLTGVIRYYQTGLHSNEQELQYLLTFVNSCGIMIRFDHLATLTADFAKIAETVPEPKLDDTRGMPLQDQPSFKAGTVVATNVGAPNGSNTGFDFGVYDLRQANEISKNATWAAIHKNEASQNFHGVCWLDWLPKADATRANALLAKAENSHKGASDYCANAPGGSTLKYNNGQPVL